MTELWPWLIMAVGVFALLIWGMFRARIIRLFYRRSLRLRAGDQLESMMDSQTGEPRAVRVIQQLMPVVISLVIGGAALYMILSDYPDAQLKWAFGSVGTIVGYWLKSAQS